MKTAEMNINTGAKAINNIKKYTDNVIIRMSDFYPDSVGDQEYCMVSKAVYAELLKFEALEDDADLTEIAPDNTPTVIINVNDFYQRYDSKEEYREVSREEFNILMAINMPYAVGYSDCGTSYKVVVMTKDFYPFLCSEKEYTELDGKIYEMLVSFKSEKESNTDKVVEFESDFDEIEDSALIDDEFDLEDDDEESVEIYEEMLKYKELENEYEASADKDTVRIRLSDFYPDNCSKEEYCDVSREVYEELMKNKREDHAVRVKDSRYLMNYCFDEVQCGEEERKYSESNDRNIQLIIMLRELFMPFSKELFRRSVLYFVYGHSVNTIAMLESISRRNARRSVQKMKVIVKNAGYRYFF